MPPRTQQTRSQRPARAGVSGKPVGRRPPGAITRAALTVERLAREYPRAECALVHRGALQLLVATILSAQCTDQRVNVVTPELFRRYPVAADLAEADPSDIEEIIKSTGFFRAKTRAIIGMAHDIVARHGGEVPARMEDLVALAGVGRKTANVVLGVAFGTPGLPVDTHVIRLAGRLRLTSHTDPVKIEQDICSMVAPEEWTTLSLRLITHGRRVCGARSPRCGDCVLSDFCPSSRIAAVGGGAAGGAGAGGGGGIGGAGTAAGDGAAIGGAGAVVGGGAAIGGVGAPTRRPPRLPTVGARRRDTI